MKRKLALVLVILMMIPVFSACTPSAKNATSTEVTSAEKTHPKKLVVGVSFPFLNDPYFVIMRNTFIKEINARGWTINESDATSDPTKQANVIDNMISAGVDILVICAVDSQAIVPSIAAANKAGIPVFTIDNKASITKNEHVIFHIETNNYQGGEIVGQWLVKRLGGKGKIAVGNYPQIEACRQRYDGFMSALKGTDIKVVATQRGVSVDEGMKIGEAWSTSVAKEIQAVYATDDNTAYGIMTAFLNNGIKNVFVTAVDGQELSQKAMIDGLPFGASGAQRPRLMTELLMQAVDRYLLGKKIPEFVQIPVILITPENAASINIPENKGYPEFSIDWKAYD